ncbi:nuclease [Cellvibrio zantedeschiae]|uniref:phosphodiesterase I n=1 Tax=Cellvibrio zantedeschiae TaxID=1237077 RepID=A0ABQ3AYQ0_9GAMM|nr:VRR-NUC domain-containing protein [Cellvibrio zantedeschiae]GGY68138.1 nuclease [Cellvibrio zantedeschiae]
MNATPDLPPTYYLSNFTFLVDWVAVRYEDLLTQEERDFADTFQHLPLHSQCLFVRLSSRKGPFFRADKINYPEINSLEDAAKYLIECGFIDIQVLLSFHEVAHLLTKAELVEAFSVNSKSERKSNLIDQLAHLYPSTKEWQQWTNKQLGLVYCLKTQHIIDNFLLLFFGNSHQDLTEFVLQDIGLFRYENYTIDEQHRIFKTREELELYKHLIILREQLELASTHENLVEIARQIPDSIQAHTLRRRRSKLCNQLAYKFERQHQVDLALSLYRQSELPPARERQIRLLEKQEKYLEAWDMLESLLTAPVDEQELQIAERISLRLAKKLGKSYSKKTPSSVTERSLTLVNPYNISGTQQLNVEEIVRLHFHSTEAPCIYVENQLLTGLFGLWLWPEMFRSLDGAFANPFQSAPLDMYEASFSLKRPRITELFCLFEDGYHKQHIRDMWRMKQGLANHFVNWHFFNEEILNLALEVIPAQHLALIFKRILFDVRNNRSGLPDLIQFFPDKNDYLMLEVKGPGDRIQDNQRRWLDFFSANKIPAEVVYVSWQ